MKAPDLKQLSENRKLALAALALILWNLGMFGFSLWKPLWHLGLLVNFLFIVALAEALGRRVSTRYKRIYERALAVGFPILLLLAWELIVGARILNPRWFPPPSKIAVALWQLAVNYDPFTKTSLLVVMMLGVFLTIGLKWLERKVMPWQREEQKHPRTNKNT